MRKNRIEEHFARAAQEGRKSLVLFLTAGFPDLQTTERIVGTIAAAGADVLELGVPFSDPIADGPTIQAASQVALKGGTTLEKILELVKRIRERTQIPIVLFGAYNPFLHYGLEKLARRAVEVGVDGFLAPDLPMEESGEFDAVCRGAGLCLVYLVAPTTPPDRMREIARRSTGFLYFISLKGVTGTSIVVSEALREKVRQAREAAGALRDGTGRLRKAGPSRQPVGSRRGKARGTDEAAGARCETKTMREMGTLREAGTLHGEAGPLREAGPLPVAVGFGIQTPQHAAAIAEISDAVVVGSELIRVVDRYKDAPDLLERVADYTRSLKEALQGRSV